MDAEIFRVELTIEGERWLRRFHAIAKVMLVATILINGIELYVLLSSFFKNSQGGNTISPMAFRDVVYLAFLLSNFALQFIQILFYLWFARQATRSVDTGNSPAFNNSIRWLVWQSVCFLLQVLTAFVYFAYTIFIDHH